MKKCVSRSAAIVADLEYGWVWDSLRFENLSVDADPANAAVRGDDESQARTQKGIYP
jgi:hypothetical protein